MEEHDAVSGKASTVMRMQDPARADAASSRHQPLLCSSLGESEHPLRAHRVPRPSLRVFRMHIGTISPLLAHLDVHPAPLATCPGRRK